MLWNGKEFLQFLSLIIRCCAIYFLIKLCYTFFQILRLHFYVQSSQVSQSWGSKNNKIIFKMWKIEIVDEVRFFVYNS